jgi:hypothetical protein
VRPVSRLREAFLGLANPLVVFVPELAARLPWFVWGAKGASFSSPATKRRCHRIADDLALGRVASTDSERHPGGERFDQGQREERHD